MIQGSRWQLKHNIFWAPNKQTKFSEPHKLLQSLCINNKKKILLELQALQDFLSQQEPSSKLNKHQ